MLMLAGLTPLLVAGPGALCSEAGAQDHSPAHVAPVQQQALNSNAGLACADHAEAGSRSVPDGSPAGLPWDEPSPPTTPCCSAGTICAGTGLTAPSVTLADAWTTHSALPVESPRTLHDSELPLLEHPPRA